MLRTTRRDFLRTGLTAACGLTVAPGLLRRENAAFPASKSEKAYVTLRIGTVLVELDSEHTISTVGYNGQAPGPLVRLREGVPVTVELINDTDTPELVHWHGQTIPADVDGAAEENSIRVPPHETVRYQLTPGPTGTRFVHTHAEAKDDLDRGTYTGQFAMVYIEPKQEPGHYDQEFFLATHEWEPYFTAEEEEEEEGEDSGHKEKEAGKIEKPNGWEIGYRLFSINGKALGGGEPLRVRQDQRVMFRILNASATENIQLALPGHEFEIVALDGNPVPRPQKVAVLQLGTAERIDAIVEMNHPGVWILGTPKNDDRKNGMGIVVEYANRKGTPQWIAPPKVKWDYTMFGAQGATSKPDEVIPMLFGKINGGKGHFNTWTINGKAFEEQGPPQILKKGLRYRLAFDNRTDDPHPLHLHRNTFELTSVKERATSGIRKDVVLIQPFSQIDVDFTADNPGLTLFHCHQQLHMDFGFKKLFTVV